jgi:adenosylcobinamide kinase / adenosylcobinamide-phosphate guanylyltransferase
MGSLSFVTGGARSGKSNFALERAKSAGGTHVSFIAPAQAFDAEMTERISRHRLERQNLGWITLEEPLDLAHAFAQVQTEVVLLDCLSLWVSNLLLAGVSEAETLERCEVWLELACHKTLWVVSNEVGLGIVPEYPLGRQFRDVLGRANQKVAARADQAWLLVAGLPLRLK